MLHGTGIFTYIWPKYIPRDPGSPKLRMGAWNPTTMRFDFSDWTAQKSSAENMTVDS